MIPTSGTQKPEELTPIKGKAQPTLTDRAFDFMGETIPRSTLAKGLTVIQIFHGTLNDNHLAYKFPYHLDNSQ